MTRPLEYPYNREANHFATYLHCYINPSYIHSFYINASYNQTVYIQGALKWIGCFKNGDSN